MAITFQDYTADASQTEFAFNFPYLEDEHVTVFVDGVQKTLTTDFTIQTSPAKKVILNTPATGGEVVRVRRISAPAVDLVDFVNGSVLTESELDRAYLHNRYLAEESSEQNDVSMRLTAGAVGWDGLTKRILNIVDPVNEQDVATKNYVDGVIGDVALGEVPDDSITYAKIQDAVGNNVLLGNDNGAGEEVQELNATEVRAILNVADGAEVNVQSDWNEADTNSDAFIQNKPIFVPTGTVSAFAGSAAPTGYVLCDGSEYDQTAQAALFAVVGSTYNTGGETANHFRVPDLRGRVVAGMGGSLLSGTDAVADTGGASTHTLTEAEMPSHQHFSFKSASGATNVTSTSTPLTNYAAAGTADYTIKGQGADADVGLTSLSGSGSAHNNVQPTMILNYIIKT
jgi:microcystin-dependent protein